MAGRDEMKLLGACFSPFAHRVEVTLKLKGISYEVIEQDLQNKSHSLLQFNSVYKRIPVLIHNGKPISESVVIIEYLDDICKQNPLFSPDPYQKAMARFWAKFAEEKFTEVVRKIIVTEGEEQEKQVKLAIEALEILEAELNGNKYFGGEIFGFVDIVLCWISRWVGVIEKTADVAILDLEKFPNLEAWIQNVLHLPIVKETMPPHDKLIQYFAKIRQFALASAAAN
ncbi:probable glutathione S-transferase [Mercurialis annua]|uniref:probable glutathione S-transferase n=1 Tax=Mercurialis annua TaxID=3986 RepID=UPI002160693B|nr:probable glutathione S-transferase [Mercurialis annua]